MAIGRLIPVGIGQRRAHAGDAVGVAEQAALAVHHLQTAQRAAETVTAPSGQARHIPNLTAGVWDCQLRGFRNCYRNRMMRSGKYKYGLHTKAAGPLLGSLQSKLQTQFIFVK